MRLFSKLRICLALVGIAFCLGRSAFAEQKTFTLEPAQTKVAFTLDTTLHTVHGTFALKRGHITLDDATGQAGGELVVDATTGNTGNDGRDNKMHKDVLESRKFPDIVFTPQRYKGTLAAEGRSHLEIEGQFGIHGQTHPMTMTIDVDFGTNKVAADTSFVIPYVKWGMKNPGNFLLHVNEKVEISIHAVARAASAGLQPAVPQRPVATQASSH